MSMGKCQRTVIDPADFVARLNRVRAAVREMEEDIAYDLERRS